MMGKAKLKDLEAQIDWNNLSIRAISLVSEDLVKTHLNLFPEEIVKIPWYKHKVRLVSN